MRLVAYLKPTFARKCELKAQITDSAPLRIYFPPQTVATALHVRRGGYVFTLFVCLLAGLCRTTQPIFTKKSIERRQEAHGRWKNTLDFGGNPDHITLGLE